MDHLRAILKSFVEETKAILGDTLVGVYLHGSAAMGCYHDHASDIDLLVVVHSELSDEVKLRYLHQITALQALAPKKGIEFSIVRKEVCNPFVYPTPFELHFSVAHWAWYKNDPADYVAKMKGVDQDLAAHFTILYHRGKCLYGEAIQQVFGEVRPAYYFDSIWNDIAQAETEITEQPTYIILNLCRVLAYGKEGLILSKSEGGQWGMAQLPAEYQGLVQQAMEHYEGNVPFRLDADCARGYAAYMLEQIQHAATPLLP